MSALPTTSLTTIQAYRHTYRALLHAVQFAKPARYIVRDQLRNTFKNGQPEDLNQLKIARTLEFLDGAARETGLEHKILKNLVHTAWSKKELFKRPIQHSKKASLVKEIRDTSHIPYQMTIALLNKQMGLCIPLG